MSDTQSQFKRLARFIDLSNRQLSLASRATPEQVNDDVPRGLRDVLQGYEELAETPDDPLTPRRNIEERIADTTEWLARAYDALGDVAQSLALYNEASRRYAALGDQRAVRRIADRLAETRLHSSQDIDAEIKRLSEQLAAVERGTLEHAKILVSLGEACSTAGDDRGAQKWLQDAEQLTMRAPLRLPAADAMLGALAETLHGLAQPPASGTPTPVERALELRALHQRLYLALSRAYENSDPSKSAAYANRVTDMDRDRSSPEMRQSLLNAVKAAIKT